MDAKCYPCSVKVHFVTTPRTPAQYSPGGYCGKESDPIHTTCRGERCGLGVTNVKQRYAKDRIERSVAEVKSISVESAGVQLRTETSGAQTCSRIPMRRDVGLGVTLHARHEARIEAREVVICAEVRELLIRGWYFQRDAIVTAMCQATDTFTTLAALAGACCVITTW